MSASSTLPAVKAQLVSVLTTALDVPCFYAWSPDVTDTCVFLGRALLDPTDRDEIEITYQYPTAELNRPCTETYAVPVSLWSFRGDLSPDSASEADGDIAALYDAVLAVFNDTDLALGASVNVRPERVPWRRVPFQSGWASFAVLEVTVVATLT